MAAANFGLLARRWVFSVLDADPTLKTLGCTGFYESPGPIGAKFPFVSWSTDTPFIPQHDVSDNTLHAIGHLRIRVNDDGRSYEAMAPIADRLIELLDEVNNAPIPGGGWILTCRYNLDHTWTEDRTAAGALISHRSLGAVYRIAIQAPD